ncbi:MAG TPA: hypothetical protein VKE27_10880 [Candidatus Dormibacteraeota bacterium]|nr:hypothetical protein [Candidatus Dormibacteraeota bacterium]
MNATLTMRQLRAVGLLVAVVVLATGYLVLSHHKSTSPSVGSAPAVTLPATTPAPTTPTETTPASGNGHTHGVAPGNLATHGLPAGVARALQKHSIVVVSLGSPQDTLNSVSVGEAQAAAAAMNVGYVYINVNHQGPGTTLLRKLGVFTTPTTLVVKRFGNIYSQFRGFVDRDVVEQAIADAHS